MKEGTCSVNLNLDLWGESWIEGELINMTRAWQESNPWPPDQALYSLSYEKSWKARAFNWVHRWQAACILLGSALSKSSWIVMNEERWWILSSVMKCERWIDQHDTSVGQRKKSESPTGIEPMTSRAQGGCSIHWATRIHLLLGKSTFVVRINWIFSQSTLSSSFQSAYIL